jgi:DNA damage-inducible protein 1
MPNVVTNWSVESKIMQLFKQRCGFVIRISHKRHLYTADGCFLGRVHMAQIQIEGDFLASSFSILEEQPMDMLLGK